VASEEEPEDMTNEQGFQKDEDKMVIESKIDPKEWILECERAAAKLKI
jgi:estrogen-related receptor beta like 1